MSQKVLDGVASVTQKKDRKPKNAGGKNRSDKFTWSEDDLVLVKKPPKEKQPNGKETGGKETGGKGKGTNQ